MDWLIFWAFLLYMNLDLEATTNQVHQQKRKLWVENGICSRKSNGKMFVMRYSTRWGAKAQSAKGQPWYKVTMQIFIRWLTCRGHCRLRSSRSIRWSGASQSSGIIRRTGSVFFRRRRALQGLVLLLRFLCLIFLHFCVLKAASCKRQIANGAICTHPAASCASSWRRSPRADRQCRAIWRHPLCGLQGGVLIAAYSPCSSACWNGNLMLGHDLEFLSKALRKNQAN